MMAKFPDMGGFVKGIHLKGIDPDNPGQAIFEMSFDTAVPNTWTEIDKSIYLTYELAAIEDYNNMLDSDFDVLKKEYEKYYKDGMTQKELAYEVIRQNYA